MAVIQMSERELSRLRVMIDLADGRLTVEAAGALMGVGRRQVFRLSRAFAAAGELGLVSRKRGRPSNRRRTPRSGARCWPWFATTMPILARRSRRRSWSRAMDCVWEWRRCGNDDRGWPLDRSEAAQIGGTGTELI